MMNYSANFLVVGLLLMISAVYGAKQHLHLHNNFMLDYEVTPVNGSLPRWIIFDIQATNISGWIGIGVNEMGSAMPGADMFIGGVNGTNELWGDDYYVPKDASTKNNTMFPVRDTIQNWVKVKAQRKGGDANITITRLLDTNDTAHDTIIPDKKIFLIWAFNANSSDLQAKHTQQGSKSINLLSGANQTVVGIFTLLLGLMAALKS